MKALFFGKSVRSKSSCFFGLWLLTIITFLSQRECCAAEMGWRADIKSVVYGDSTCHASASGIKYIFKKQGYTWLSYAPEWPGIVYNDRARLCFKTSLKDYAHRLTHSISVGGHDIDPALWVKAGAGVLDGAKAVKYVYRSKKMHPDVMTAECWFSEEIAVSPQIAKYTAELYRTPANDHILLHLVEHISDDGSASIIVDTTGLKRVPLPPDCFSYPKNYRQAADNMQVVMGQEGGELLDDFFKSSTR